MENHQQQVQEQEQKVETFQQNPKTMLFIRIMSKRRTWVALFVLVYGIILYSSWNLIQSILSWYRTSAAPSTHSAPPSSALAAAYAAAMLGLVFGAMSMAAALAVAVPAMMVTWITILVLLAFCGRGRRDLVVEGKKLTAEISGVVVRVLIKEGNFVAAVCAVLGYFLLVRKGSDESTTT